MSVLDIIEKRFSVRGYLDKEVESDKLDKVLKAAQLAPTGVNAQSFKIYVIDTKKHRDVLEKVAQWDWFFEAPLILALVGDYDKAWTRSWDGKNIMDIDAGIVMDHMILEATELGLGTCFIAAFHEEALIELLNLEGNKKPVLLTPLGYPDAEPRDAPRKSLDELVEYI